MQTKSCHHSGRVVPALFLLAAFLPLYLAFRSASLDDFDSYSFALALRQFSLDLQQPQPPGFPVYVALGRLLLAVCGEARPALTLLSALAGVGVVLGVYGLGGRRTLAGVGAALLVGLSPMGWLTAEKALSDTPGMALTLLAIWALWRGRERLSTFILGSFIAGLGLGLRPQNSLPVLLLLAGLVVRHLWLRRPWRWLGAAALAFAGGVLLWLLPTLRAVGGLSTYLAHLAAHSAHVRRADSLLGAPLTASALHGRWMAFANTLLMHTVGLTVYARWGWPQTIRALAVAAVVLPGLIAADWRRSRTWLLAGWALLVATQVFLLEALDRPRLFLPLLPPLALLVAEGYARLRSPRWLAPAVLTGAAFALLRLTLPLAAQLSTVPAPPVQAASYVAAHYPPQETVIAAAGSFRAVQVELPNYHRVLYLYYRFDPAVARAAVREPTIHYVVIFDRDQFSDETLSALSDDGRLVPLEERTFSRDPRVHTQHSQVRLQVLTPTDWVSPALNLPPDGCLDIGGGEDGRYLERGWYYTENIGGVIGRWVGGVPTATVRLFLPPGPDYRLTLRALAYPDRQEVTVLVNGETVGHFRLGGDWQTFTLTVPGEVVSAGISRLELRHSRLLAPFDQTGGGSSDRRPLAAAYDWLCFSPLDD
ncbi:MAG: hypothetical protein ACPLYD_14860 [Anaerolineae bacterium]